MSPQIPERIRQIHVDCYSNIFNIYQATTRLYGTETLCGDWSGTILLLAQDFANLSCLEERMRKAPKDNPYYHDPMSETNIRLMALLAENGIALDGSNAERCGVLYGSACWLIKETPHMSSPLPNKGAMMIESIEVLKFALGEMRHLRHIICVGKFAHGMVRALSGNGANKLRHRQKWREFVASGETFRLGDRSVHASAHTSKWGVRNRSASKNYAEGLVLVREDWQAIFKRIEEGGHPVLS